MLKEVTKILETITKEASDVILKNSNETASIPLNAKQVYEIEEESKSLRKALISIEEVCREVNSKFELRTLNDDLLKLSDKLAWPDSPPFDLFTSTRTLKKEGFINYLNVETGDLEPGSYFLCNDLFVRILKATLQLKTTPVSQHVHDRPSLSFIHGFNIIFLKTNSCSLLFPKWDNTK